MSRSSFNNGRKKTSPEGRCTWFLPFQHFNFMFLPPLRQKERIPARAHVTSISFSDIKSRSLLILFLSSSTSILRTAVKRHPQHHRTTSNGFVRDPCSVTSHHSTCSFAASFSEISHLEQLRRLLVFSIITRRLGTFHVTQRKQHLTDASEGNPSGSDRTRLVMSFTASNVLFEEPPWPSDLQTPIAAIFQQDIAYDDTLDTISSSIRNTISPGLKDDHKLLQLKQGEKGFLYAKNEASSRGYVLVMRSGEPLHGEFAHTKLATDLYD